MILQPPAIMIMGPPGSGKTDVITTALARDMEVFSIVTEPGGAEVLLDACERRKLDIGKLHWTTCLPAMVHLSALGQMIQTIAGNSYEDITKIKSGVGKNETRQPAMKLLEALQNFQCERTGQAFGSFTTWSDECLLALDSLSGLSLISMALTIGFKPAAHQGEWGVAMNFVEQLLLKLTADRKCFFVMTAHIEKEMDEINGVNQIMASTLGRKLAPKIPRFFSEVVRATRTIDASGKPQFKWSTVDRNADLKNRALPVSDNIVPDLAPIIDAYRRRRSLAGGSAATSTATATPTPAPAAKPVVPPAAPMRPTAATTQRT